VNRETRPKKAASAMIVDTLETRGRKSPGPGGTAREETLPERVVESLQHAIRRGLRPRFFWYKPNLRLRKPTAPKPAGAKADST